MQRVEQRVHHHAHQHDLRHALPDRPEHQQDHGEDRTREIAEAGNQRQDRIEPEPDLRAGNPEARVEQVRPRRRKRKVSRNVITDCRQSLVVRERAARPTLSSRRDAGTARGVNFALFPSTRRRSNSVSSIARTRRSNTSASRCCDAPTTSGTGTCPTSRPGQLYGYRVYGPWDPAHGHRFNPAKVLLDPYARAIGRPPTWHPSLLASRRAPTPTAPSIDRQRAVRAARRRRRAAFAATTIAPPRTPWRRHGDLRAARQGLHGAESEAIPPELRGTYLGLASRAGRSITCRRLGVTAVELLPVHQHADEPALVARGLTNYWGYNTLSFFAPDVASRRRDRRSTPPREFKTMVRALHAAGLEVILDVVYNHTAEGDHRGPDAVVPRHRQRERTTGSMPDRPARYEDFTGSGNTLNMQSPQALQLVHGQPALLGRGDARRRVPLRSRVGARARAARRSIALVVVLRRRSQQDPVISRVKLIAEPWDVGDGRLSGRQLSAGMDRVERPLSRRRAPLLARRRRRAARTGRRGSPAAAICTARRAASRTRASTSSRRTTASRSPISSRTTRSTTRRTARTTATATATTSAGTAASKGRPAMPAILELRAPPAAQFPADALRLARRADDLAAATNSAARSTATTTPTARTTS